jgi:hypothetical protein
MSDRNIPTDGRLTWKHVTRDGRTYWHLFNANGTEARPIIGIEGHLIEEIELLRSALVKSVATIQTWHNQGIPVRECSKLWDIYWRNAPEMKPIREALTALREVSDGK